ncbi:hypothetical protein SAMN05428964_1052 [Thalassospira xiamenensis]|uniref:Uncharacterized protein n=1 Tax=Thalassospira xiamenensis TaxID=220697 RepID=A0A285TR79_9PROT|nr:hypothetical protein SAMN05428964_1052 [Thalassospira xiamenensis]
MREGCATSGPCTLDDFLEFERARIEAFKAYWLRCHELYPEQFPMTLDPGQWDEALMIFDISDSEPPDIDPIARQAPPFSAGKDSADGAAVPGLSAAPAHAHRSRV